MYDRLHRRRPQRRGTLCRHRQLPSDRSGRMERQEHRPGIEAAVYPICNGCQLFIQSGHLCHTPIGQRRVAGSPVEEGPRAPLVCQNPHGLRSEVEQSWCNSRNGHVVLACLCHVRPVLEEPEVVGAIGAIVHVRAVDEVLALVRNVGEVLQAGPIVHWLRERSIWCAGPLRRSWKVAVLSCDARYCDHDCQVQCRTGRHFRLRWMLTEVTDPWRGQGQDI